MKRWLSQFTRLLVPGIALLMVALPLAGCSNDADVASRNISQAADNFEIPRRIVFYNGITNDYMLEIAGYCTNEPHGTPFKRLAVVCKTGPGQYKKHFLGLSDNVTYFTEQLDAAQVSTSFYRVTFKPSTIIPAVQLR
jgi:hypothetical protein